MDSAPAVEVRFGDALPFPVRSAEVTVVRGYAVRHEGATYEAPWLFFAHLEPAWAYGRAAAMSPQASTWTIRQAALASTPAGMAGQGRQVLHLAGLVPWNTEGTFDARTLARWLEGMSGASREWSPLR